MMELWPFTNFHDLNLDWIIKTVRSWVEKMQTFQDSITAGWDAMRDDFSKYVNVTENALNTGAIADGAITYQKLNESIREYVTPEMFGAIGDGIADDTQAVQTAVDTGDHVIFTKTYLVSINPDTIIGPMGNRAGHAITLDNNKTLEFTAGSIIRLSSTDIEGGSIFKALQKQNIKFTGDGEIIGDKNTHDGITGESGHGIELMACTDVEISGIDISDNWGDGLYIGSGNITPCTNIRIHDCNISNNSRNNISLVAADGCYITNVTVNGATRVAPFSGIDIEPNDNGIDYVDNCIIDNIIADDNKRYGIGCAFYTSLENKVKINNVTTNKQTGIMCQDGTNTVTITNHYFKSAADDASVEARRAFLIQSNTDSAVNIEGVANMDTDTSYIKNLICPITEMNNVSVNMIAEGLNGFNNVFEGLSFTHNNISVKLLIKCPQTVYDSSVQADALDYANIIFSKPRTIESGTQGVNPMGGNFIVNSNSGALYIPYAHIRKGAKFIITVANRGSTYNAFNESLPDNSYNEFECFKDTVVKLTKQILL